MKAALKSARPALERAKPPTVAQKQAGADVRGFPSSMSADEQIKSMAALYDLDHRLWPRYRESLIALIEKGDEMLAAAKYLRAPHASKEYKAEAEAERKLDKAIVVYSKKREELG